MFTSPAGGVSEDLEFFIRRRPHFSSICSRKQHKLFIAPAPIAHLQTGNTKPLRIVTKWFMPGIDPEDLYEDLVKENIHREAESGQCRSI